MWVVLMLWLVFLLVPVLFEDDERRILHQDEEHSRIFLFEPLQAASLADDDHRYREREVSRWHCIVYVGK